MIICKKTIINYVNDTINLKERRKDNNPGLTINSLIVDKPKDKETFEEFKEEQEQEILELLQENDKLNAEIEEL